MSFDEQQKARPRLDAYATEDAIFQFPRLVRIELFSQLSPSELGRFCGTGRRAALAICGFGNVQSRRVVGEDGAPKLVHALTDANGAILDLFDDAEVMPEVWQAFLARDYGLAPVAADCAAFTPYERRLVAESFARYAPPSLDNLERLRRLRRLYAKLWASADTTYRFEPGVAALPNTVAFYTRDGIVIERSKGRVLMTSVIDLVAAEFEGNGRDRKTEGANPTSIELFKSGNESFPNENLQGVIGSPFHTGAYLIVTDVQTYAVVMRDADFWVVPVSFDIGEVCVDAREPNKFYFSGPQPLKFLPFVIDAALEAPNLQQLNVSTTYTYISTETGAERSGSLLSIPNDISAERVAGLALLTERVSVAFAREDRSLVEYDLYTGRGQRIRHATEETYAYLVPILRAERNGNEQAGRFGTTVLRLGFDPWGFRVVVQNLPELGSRRETPALFYRLDGRLNLDFSRVGPTSFLISSSYDSLFFDWDTGLRWPEPYTRVAFVNWRSNTGAPPVWIARPASSYPTYSTERQPAKVLEPVQL